MQSTQINITQDALEQALRVRRIKQAQIRHLRAQLAAKGHMAPTPLIIQELSRTPPPIQAQPHYIAALTRDARTAQKQTLKAAQTLLSLEQEQAHLEALLNTLTKTQRFLLHQRYILQKDWPEVQAAFQAQFTHPSNQHKAPLAQSLPLPLLESFTESALKTLTKLDKPSRPL